MKTSKRRFAFVTTSLFLASIGASARAEDSRQVVGGDLLYTASASAPKESEAVFEAEGRAVEMLAVECGFPPRESKLYRQESERLGQWYRAQVRVGVPIADCETARHGPSGSGGKENQTLSAVLKSYEGRRSGEAFATRPVKSEPELRFVFSSEDTISAERAIERKARAREFLRASMK